MAGISIIIPVFNKLDTTQQCIRHIREFNGGCDHEVIIVDNGSTDGTQEVLMNDPEIRYVRNDENLGVAKALNAGAAEAACDLLCFMHNDVFVHEKNWTARLGEFIGSTPDAGAVGLYGAQTIRADSSFRGRSIVHAKRDSPSLSKPFAKVAVVDGLLLAMRRSVFDAAGGFTGEFIMHFYDKDMSLKVLARGYTNYVINIPFEHCAATTRSGMRNDDSIRDRAKRKFLDLWAASLPVDVTTWREKIGYMLKDKGTSS